MARLLCCLLGVVALAQGAANVVFFLVDDLGVMDLSCYGSDFHESPSIDKLAGAGMRFTNAYASHPVCGPSRSAIATGCFPARLGVVKIGGKIPAGHAIWPKVLKEAGYATWFGGKWHMGGAQSVTANGFDVNVTGCNIGQPADFYFPYKGIPASQNIPGLTDGKPGDYLTDALTDKAIDFLSSHGKEPFLLYFSYYNVHKPAQPLGATKRTPKRRAQGKTEHSEYFRKKLAAFPDSERDLRPESYETGTVPMATRQREPEFASQIKAVDDSVGRVLAKIEELGVADNTIVIFTSDQGSMTTTEGLAVSSALPYRFGKGFAYEGGIRVPFIVKWPGVTQSGASNDTVTINTDIYPTILDMLGMDARPKQHVDGISLTPALRGATMPFSRTFYWIYPSNHGLGHKGSVAIRQGAHKLIHWPRSGVQALYNLEVDIGERQNLSQTNPELAERLMRNLRAWAPGSRYLK
jgi:arylsulfatase A-like enzyme